MTTDLSIENDTETYDGEIGSEWLFLNPDKPLDRVFTFASRLEDVGCREKHDCEMKNNTKVLVLSEPVEAWHPARPGDGKFLVSRVLAPSHPAMWVPTACLVPIDRKPNDSA